jgi:hypothetical protein
VYRPVADVDGRQRAVIEGVLNALLRTLHVLDVNERTTDAHACCVDALAHCIALEGRCLDCRLPAVLDAVNLVAVRADHLSTSRDEGPTCLLQAGSLSASLGVCPAACNRTPALSRHVADCFAMAAWRRLEIVQ